MAGPPTSSIDMQAMPLLIEALEEASQTLHMLRSELQVEAVARSVSTSGLTRVGEVASWIDEKLPDLQRRLDICLAMQASDLTGLRQPVVTLEEPVISPEEAAEVGRELAVKLAEWPDDDTLNEVAMRLAHHQDDPEVSSAFWELVPSELVDELASRCASYPGGHHDFRVFSTSLVAAMYDSTPSPGCEALFEYLQQPAPDDGVRWNRLALIQARQTPPEFLQSMVSTHALEPLTSENYLFDVAAERAAALELPANNVALAFHALQRDAESSRQLLTSGPGLDWYLQNVYSHHFRAERLQEEFARTLLAGAGVYDELEGHSEVAAGFAFVVLTNLPDRLEVSHEVRGRYAELAASYAPEMLTGASIADATGRDTSQEKPKNWSQIIGVDPHFYLSVDDTRAILDMFTESDDLVEPFDEAVVALYDDVIRQAISRDLSGIEDDGQRYLDVSANFGQLAGLQYESARGLRGEMDARDKEQEEIASGLLTLGLTTVPEPRSQALRYAWKGATWAAGRALGAADSKGEKTRVELLEDQADEILYRWQFEFTRILLEEDPQRARSLPPELVDASGDLIGIDEILASDETFNAYGDWLDSQDEDGAAHTTDKMTERSGGLFSGEFGGVVRPFGDD